MTEPHTETAHRTPHSPTESDVEGQGGAARGRAREGSGQSSAVVTLRERAERLVPWLEATFRPPLVWTEPPASLADLAAYARSAAWTGRSGPARTIGVWWCRLVAVPVSTLAYYAAWIVQRPARALTLVAVYFTVSQSSFGSWLPWLW